MSIFSSRVICLRIASTRFSISARLGDAARTARRIPVRDRLTAASECPMVRMRSKSLSLDGDCEVGGLQPDAAAPDLEPGEDVGQAPRALDIAARDSILDELVKIER